MKKSNLPTNLLLIRSVWGMNRMEIGALLSCTKNQIGGYERGSMNIPPSIIFDLESMTGISARRLYYEELARLDIPNQPLSPTTELANKLPSQEIGVQAPNNAKNLSLAERVKRLEMKVFGSTVS